jgi:hypothetical protein
MNKTNEKQNKTEQLNTKRNNNKTEQLNTKRNDNKTLILHTVYVLQSTYRYKYM